MHRRPIIRRRAVWWGFRVDRHVRPLRGGCGPAGLRRSVAGHGGTSLRAAARVKPSPGLAVNESPGLLSRRPALTRVASFLYSFVLYLDVDLRHTSHGPTYSADDLFGVDTGPVGLRHLTIRFHELRVSQLWPFLQRCDPTLTHLHLLGCILSDDDDDPRPPSPCSPVVLTAMVSDLRTERWLPSLFTTRLCTLYLTVLPDACEHDTLRLVVERAPGLRSLHLQWA